MSERIVGLLRGINVGGSRRLKMADLRALVESLGHTDVETYLQSGNVVFTPTGRGRSKVGDAISAAITAATGMDVGVLTRTGKEMAAVVAANPYPVDDPTKVVVTFMSRPPDAELFADIDPSEYAPDEFTVSGSELYLHLPNGQARSKLVEVLWKRHLAPTSTARNWRTVTALAEMSGR